MNSLHDGWTVFQHGAYVAFAFSVLLFGALAFRQILDNLELRRQRCGEDLLLLHSAPGVLLVLLGASLTVMVGVFCYSLQPPTVFRYALPLVGGVQMVQIFLRLHFQRIRIRTLAIVVRPIVRPGPIVVRYTDISSVEFVDATLWTTVHLKDRQGQAVSFRIFPFRREALASRLRQTTNPELHH